MDEVLTMPSAEDAAQLQVILSQCITEIDRLREIMCQDDIEIARMTLRSRGLRHGRAPFLRKSRPCELCRDSEEANKAAVPYVVTAAFVVSVAIMQNFRDVSG